jgi:hypothetical protein
VGQRWPSIFPSTSIVAPPDPLLTQPFRGNGTCSLTMQVRFLDPRDKPRILTRSTLFLEARQGAALVDHIYMDAMGFGMGCCCLQLTFQCCNIEDARRMYDALIPIGPIMVRRSFFAPALGLYIPILIPLICSWP